MKILHVLYSGLGGHGNVFFSMISADKAREFDHEALFYGVEDVRQEFIEQCAENNIPWYAAKKNVKLDLKYYYTILRYIRKSDPDIIFLHGSAYILPAKIAAVFSKKKRKIIIRETQANHLKTKAQWVSLSAAMFLANHIVCLTEEFKEQVKKKLGWIYKSKKVVVISNGIDLDSFKPGTTVGEKQMIIGMQSRLTPNKDHVTLLKAFAILQKNYAGRIKLKIAGDGDCKETLIKYAADSDIAADVEFTGILSEKDLVVFLQELTIYVHASLGETMSTAIMQAMACRLPIIASDVNGINNMITPGITGILVPPGNESSLAAAISQSMEDPNTRDKLAQHALDYARLNFSNQKMMASYKNIFL